MSSKLPPCGVYRTTQAIGGVPAGRLVFFHNHGDPGPGVYLPASWKHNQARWQKRGVPLGDPQDANTLQPLPAQGFYRVAEAFHCCERRCRRFEPEMLVQLGYNAAAEPIVFVPQLVEGMLAVPERGQKIDPEHLRRLTQLRVAKESEAPAAGPAVDPSMIH